MISIIIPTYNEETTIRQTVQKLYQHDTRDLIREIIAVDGGSTDNTVALARQQGIKAIQAPKKGRAAQMNYGAALSTGPILYFLHADTVPPPDFTGDIVQAVEQGCRAGCYRLSFDYNHWFLRANCWFTRFNFSAFRFGDQSLFVDKESFGQAGGFSEDHIVLEDQHLIRQLSKKVRFVVLKRPVLTSARKYLENGIYKTQFVFFFIYFMYRVGYSQRRLVATYKKLLSQHKL